jgi:hypothetical protein
MNPLPLTQVEDIKSRFKQYAAINQDLNKDNNKYVFRFVEKPYLPPYNNQLPVTNNLLQDLSENL